MENMNPTLVLVSHLRYCIERGQSVREALKNLPLLADYKFEQQIIQWLALRDSGVNPQEILDSVKSHYRQAVLRVLDSGLAGGSVYQALTLIEIEVKEAVAQEVDKFVALLPLKMLVPLLLLQFPAFLILLFGPLLNQFLRSF